MCTDLLHGEANSELQSLCCSSQLLQLMWHVQLNCDGLCLQGYIAAQLLAGV
jgi:hypothetical protein